MMKCKGVAGRWAPPKVRLGDSVLHPRFSQFMNQRTRKHTWTHVSLASKRQEARFPAVGRGNSLGRQSCGATPCLSHWILVFGLSREASHA